MVFYIIGNLFACLFWGIFISLTLIVILFFLPKFINTGYELKPLRILMLLAGFVYFTFQSTMMTGGIKLKNYLPSAVEVSRHIDIIQSDPGKAGEELSRRYPLLKDYIKDVGKNITYVQDGAAGSAEYILLYVNEIHKTVNHYIWRRIGWIVGGMVLLGFGLLNDAFKQNRKSVSRRRRMPD